MTDSFPVTPRNRVKREPDRGRYDRDAVYAVLDSAMLCHVAYVIDGQPLPRQRSTGVRGTCSTGTALRPAG